MLARVSGYHPGGKRKERRKQGRRQRRETSSLYPSLLQIPSPLTSYEGMILKERRETPVPVLSCAHYFQAPATQANTHFCVYLSIDWLIAEHHGLKNLVIHASENFDGHVTMRPSAPQSNQCKMIFFLVFMADPGWWFVSTFLPSFKHFSFHYRPSTPHHVTDKIFYSESSTPRLQIVSSFFYINSHQGPDGEWNYEKWPARFASSSLAHI